jgi:hypothetical protein
MLAVRVKPTGAATLPLLVLGRKLPLPHDVVAFLECFAVEVLLQHRLHSLLVARLQFEHMCVTATTWRHQPCSHAQSSRKTIHVSRVAWWQLRISASRHWHSSLTYRRRCGSQLQPHACHVVQQQGRHAKTSDGGLRRPALTCASSVVPDVCGVMAAHAHKLQCQSLWNGFQSPIAALACDARMR